MLLLDGGPTFALIRFSFEVPGTPQRAQVRGTLSQGRSLIIATP
jgi:hypothetical protein